MTEQSMYDNVRDIVCYTGITDIYGNRINITLLEAINTYEKFYNCKWLGCMENDDELVFRYKDNTIKTIWKDELIKIISKNE